MFTFTIVVYLVSLTKINRQLAKLESNSKVLANRRLVCSHFFVYVVEIALFFATLWIFYSNQNLFQTLDTTERECRQILAVQHLYLLIWVSMLVRISLSCYMILKQSRRIDQCNKEFMCVLNRSLRLVQQ